VQQQINPKGVVALLFMPKVIPFMPKVSPFMPKVSQFMPKGSLFMAKMSPFMPKVNPFMPKVPWVDQSLPDTPYLDTKHLARITITLRSDSAKIDQFQLFVHNSQVLLRRALQTPNTRMTSLKFSLPRAATTGSPPPHQKEVLDPSRWCCT